jgi:ATP-dependent DNA ligase
MLVAFDLIEHNGHVLRDLSLIDRKWRLSRLIGRTKTRAIHCGDHPNGDGPAVQPRSPL